MRHARVRDFGLSQLISIGSTSPIHRQQEKHERMCACACVPTTLIHMYVYFYISVL